MDTLLKIVQRAENNLLRVKEYLAGHAGGTPHSGS